MAALNNYHPFRDPHLLIVLGIIPVDSAGRLDNVWGAVHDLTTSAANYCSEHRIHPAMVCAWFGAREPSESYSEAAMLSAMALIETIKQVEIQS